MCSEAMSGRGFRVDQIYSEDVGGDTVRVDVRSSFPQLDAVRVSPKLLSAVYLSPAGARCCLRHG